MQVGFTAWDVCRRHGPEPLEVYPSGCFRALNHDALPPPKSRPVGLAARRSMLARLVDEPVGFAMWSHDGLDATVAAVTAAHAAEGRATEWGHTGAGCDGTAIWLPAAPIDGAAPSPAG
jgi:hypothetical protein